MGARLTIERLTVTFEAPGGPVRVVDGVDLVVEPGRTLCLVGESGCGKSVTALSVLRLLPETSAVRFGGRVLLGDVDVLRVPPSRLHEVRGRRVAMVFQEPMTALNPVLTIGEQLVETVRRHHGGSRAVARRIAIEMLGRVGIADPDVRMGAWPHELSGGMRQRVLIAQSLVCHPDVLIADEPTTALDVTIQAQILALIDDMREALGMGVLLITHDLRVAAATADVVAVMYAGRIVERGPAARVLGAPAHPYTVGLLRAQPSPDARSHARLRWAGIPGAPPSFAALPRGCRFAPRCPVALPECAEVDPALVRVGSDDAHAAACVHVAGVGGGRAGAHGRDLA